MTSVRFGLVLSSVAALLCATGVSCLVEIRDLRSGVGGAAMTTSTSMLGGGGSAEAGSGGVGETGGAGGGAACPSDMVHASDGNTISFCIDRTEVTQTAYVQFLAAVGGAVDVNEQPAACAFNTSLTHTPDGSCPSFTSGSDLPVTCVDWCDAHAYCDWAGKRLCGALNGGPLAHDDAPTLGEWHFACTGGFDKTYPYGDEAVEGACNIPGSSDRDPVATNPMCEGGFPGIFDMVGNVAEYVDACDAGAADPQAATCAIRGGHTFGTATFWTCDNDSESNERNDPNERENGFRCCRDAG